MKRLFTVVSVVVLALAAAGVILAQSDAHMGTWKLNAAKSKFDPGPPNKSETRTYESTGDGYKFNGEGVKADGSTQTYSFAVKYDGKDYPVTGQEPAGADTLNVKLVDANHLDSTSKKGGKALYTSRVVVSKDGKVMTLTSKGKTADGQSFNNVLVYDKQ
jgi:hypothetical protein